MDTVDTCLSTLVPYITNLNQSVATAPLNPDQRAKLGMMVATGLCTAALNHVLQAKKLREEGFDVNAGGTPPLPQTDDEIIDELMLFIGNVLKKKEPNFVPKSKIIN
jgi:hypothetical protein